MSTLSSQKIFPPSQFIKDFYYHFSSLTLFLSLIITPLLFYVILTQSKNLKTFKWLILNHSFWCFTLEMEIGLIKPLIFLPAFGGYPLGIFRDNGSYATMAFLALFGMVSSANCVIGLSATILSRYLLVFPSKLTQWFSFKITGIFMALLTIVSHIIYLFQFLPYLSNNSIQMRDLAIAYDKNFENFTCEPAFLYIPRMYGNKMMLYVFISILFLIFISFFLMGLFIYLITKFKTMTTNKLQRSLIISSIMQIFFTMLFLFLPTAFITASITFEIPNSTTLSCICFCLLSTHSLVEFIVTLYFVSPYRNFITKCWKKYFPHKKYPQIRNVQISSMSVSVTIERRFTR